MHGRGVDAGLFEHLAMQHGHHTAAAVRPFPRRAFESVTTFDALELRANVVTERFEPLPGNGFPDLSIVGHAGLRQTWQ